MKAVVVLGSSDGIKGTVQFTQEGDGNKLLRLLVEVSCGLIME